MRFFNTAGPIKPEINYYIPPLGRVDLDEVLLLIEQQRYFVMHAPRQTGKTSALLALRDELNGSGRYRCAYVNVEIGQSAREDVGAAIRAILGQIALEAEFVLSDLTLREISLDTLEAFGPHQALQGTLSRWSAADDKPLVLLIDEIDALIGDTLLAVLRQLRAGYP
ncbi:MAG: ATP-binding protein, partial [Gemmatimonadetes bacterium]|nr:ATP-binding protein [Gemmatimonadota bacterium]